MNLLEKVYKKTLSVARESWRPLGCVVLVGGMVVNGIYLPLVKGVPASLIEVGAMITAFAPLSAVRSWEKLKSPE